MHFFKRSAICSTRRLLQALAVFCLAALGRGLAAAPPQHSDELLQAAAGFDQFFLHDMCTAPYPPQPDTCLHERLHERSFTFGGKSGTVYDVTLRIRGIFEPTTITGGDTPDPEHPYFKVGKSAPDRQQIIAGVVDHPLPGQMLRLDVVRIKAR